MGPLQIHSFSITEDIPLSIRNCTACEPTQSTTIISNKLPVPRWISPAQTSLLSCNSTWTYNIPSLWCLTGILTCTCQTALLIFPSKSMYPPVFLCFNKYWIFLVNSRRNRGVTLHLPLSSPPTANQLSSPLDPISKYIFIHHSHLYLREAS